MDEAIALAAAKNGLLHLEFTQRFREVAEQSQLFFPFDGHITETGHKLFADEVRASLKNNIGDCAVPAAGE